jgi:hypothetical protein
LVSRPRAPDVTKITAQTTLELQVDDDGFVTFARFVKPLGEAVQSCAWAAYSKIRFPRTGRISIPIDYEY